jgi:hypothetical protein
MCGDMQTFEILYISLICTLLLKKIQTIHLEYVDVDVTQVLCELELTIRRVKVSTTPDGCVLDLFFITDNKSLSLSHFLFSLSKLLASLLVSFI